MGLFKLSLISCKNLQVFHKSKIIKKTKKKVLDFKLLAGHFCIMEQCQCHNKLKRRGFSDLSTAELSVGQH